ncbi:MAG: hypothetical protein ABI551_10630 [Polyangiaceae bacterium]
MARACAQCGTAIPDGVGFCGRCGAIAPLGAQGSTSAAQRPTVGTMIGIPAAGLTTPSAPPTQGPAAPLQSAERRGLATMIGMPATGFSPASPNPAPSLPPVGDDKRTLLGVAIPGIAPTQSSPPQAAVDPRNPRGNVHTMLGVAIPGVAPTHSSPPLAASGPPRPMPVLPPIVPAPAPLRLDAVPAPRQAPQKTGFPLAIVAGVIGTVVVVIGGIALFLWKQAPPVLVQPRLGPLGDDELHLTCESCPDGTTVMVGSARASFKDKAADVKLASPLKTGENPLDLSLDRPGVGRDEVVRAVVPISYRVQADLSTLDSDSPALTVRVQAAPGASVTVDGAVVQLDAQGNGTHAVDVSADLTGPADESKQLERKIPYVITARDIAGKMSTHEGSVSASAPIPPLRVDAPMPHAVVDTGSFFVAGRTIPKGAVVTANGRVLPVGANGFFGDTLTSAATATRVVVRASAPNMAPRLVVVDVRKVDSLPVEAKAFAARATLGFDAIANDPVASAGQEIVAEGTVLEARVQNHQTVLVMDDKNGCAHGPCVVRVVHGAELQLKGGDPLRVYGHVAGAAKEKQQGRVVPEIEADFVLKGLDKP